MNKHIKNLLVAAGLMALGVTSASAANVSTTNGTYNTNLRITQNALWATPVVSEGRYLNNNFSSSGNLLLGTGGSLEPINGIYEINSTTGAIVNFSTNGTGMGTTTRSAVEAGGYYYYNGPSAVYGISTNGANFSGAAASGTIPAISSSSSLVANGANVFVAAGTTLQKYSVDGSGGLTAVWGSPASFAGSTRGMSYSSAFNGVYVYNSAGMYFVDSSGSPTTLTMPSASSLEFLTQFSLDGVNYLTWGDGSSYNFAKLTSATTFGAVDTYDANATGFNIGDARGFSYKSTGATSGYGYFSETGAGSGFPVRAFNLTAVPEPSTYAMMAMGLVMSAYGLKISRRKKQSANKA